MQMRRFAAWFLHLGIKHKQHELNCEERESERRSDRGAEGQRLAESPEQRWRTRAAGGWRDFRQDAGTGFYFHPVTSTLVTPPLFHTNMLVVDGDSLIWLLRHVQRMWPRPFSLCKTHRGLRRRWVGIPSEHVCEKQRIVKVYPYAQRQKKPKTDPVYRDSEGEGGRGRQGCFPSLWRIHLVQQGRRREQELALTKFPACYYVVTIRQ